MFVSPAQGEATVQAESKRKRKGLAESDAREISGDTAAAAGT